MKTVRAFQIDGNKIKVTIERTPNGKFNYLDVTCNGSISFTNASFGEMRYRYKSNNRLRAIKSIRAEQVALYTQVRKHIEKYFKTYVIKPRTVVVEFNSYSENAYCSELGMYVKLSSIQSIQSGQCLSWYYHNVFNTGKIELTAYRTSGGQVRFKADDTNLYDISKLRELHRKGTDKLAFFKSEELKRLIGLPFNNVKSMSGLFSKGA